MPFSVLSTVISSSTIIQKEEKQSLYIKVGARSSTAIGEIGTLIDASRPLALIWCTLLKTYSLPAETSTLDKYFLRASTGQASDDCSLEDE